MIDNEYATLDLLTIGVRATHLPQFFSSELSPQSSLRLHLRNKAVIHRPLSHVN